MKMLARLMLALVLCFGTATFAMNLPGPFSLGGCNVTTAQTQVCTPNGAAIGFAGINAASFQVRMSGGTGGSKINVYIQTSLDQGQSWIDIANVAFTNTSGVEVVNLSALDKIATPVAPTDGSLADNTTVDGILGDQLRAKVVSTGTYTGATLVSVLGVAR